MQRRYYVRVTETQGCTVTVSDEPWKGELSVTGPEAVSAARITAAARRKLGLPLIIAVTPRLVLRELCAADFSAIRRLCFSEEEQGWLGEEFLKLQEEAYFRSYISAQYRFFEYGIWGFFLRSSGVLAGAAGFSPGQPPEFGYYTKAEYRRLGYAGEACRAAFHYAEKELGFTELCLRIAEKNLPSRRLAEHLAEVMRQDRSELCIQTVLV